MTDQWRHCQVPQALHHLSSMAIVFLLVHCLFSHTMCSLKDLLHLSQRNTHLNNLQICLLSNDCCTAIDTTAMIINSTKLKTLNSLWTRLPFFKHLFLLLNTQAHHHLDRLFHSAKSEWIKRISIRAKEASTRENSLWWMKWMKRWRKSLHWNAELIEHSEPQLGLSHPNIFSSVGQLICTARVTLKCLLQTILSGRSVWCDSKPEPKVKNESRMSVDFVLREEKYVFFCMSANVLSAWVSRWWVHLKRGLGSLQNA